MLNALSHRSGQSPPRRNNCLTRGRLALRCSIRFGCSWFAASRQSPDWKFRSADSATPCADSHCPCPSRTPEGPNSRNDAGCMCLHALSSFQRTDAESGLHPIPDTSNCPPSHSPSALRVAPPVRVQWNLARLLKLQRFCQHVSALLPGQSHPLRAHDDAE
jgi:hypothetical protein